MKTKRFLIAVDLQHDFIRGSLGTAEAEAIIPAAAARIRERREAGDTLIATLDTHEEDYPETREGRRLPVTHCVKGTEGWQLDPEIENALGDCVRVEKPTFGSIRLPQIIRENLGPDETPEFELIGLCTDICVVSNALLLKAAFPEADICVNSACCAGVTPEKHRAALDTMASCQIDIL